MTKTHTVGTRCRLNDAQRSYMHALLKSKCYSDAQLAEVVGVTLRVAASWRRKQKAFVESWVEDSRGRVFVPCWRIGEEANAPRPGPRETPAQRMARIRAERKK